MQAYRAGMAPTVEGADVEEVALGHGASGTVEVIANRTTWCMTGLPFLSTPLVTGKMTEGADDNCFVGVGAGIPLPTTPADMAAGTDGAGRWNIPASWRRALATWGREPRLKQAAVVAENGQQRALAFRCWEPRLMQAAVVAGNRRQRVLASPCQEPRLRQAAVVAGNRRQRRWHPGSKSSGRNELLWLLEAGRRV